MEMVKKMEKRIAPLVALAGTVCGCCSDQVATEPHVVARIADCGRYEALNPHFGKAFAFLKRADLSELKPGRYEIDGDNCWAMLRDAGRELRPPSAKWSSRSSANSVVA